ncbi:hypothetical protein AQD68_28680 [Klebsiella pneumoniae]|nr:hypothetical protein AQD73_21275 [Klebsiella pneumoniae]AMY61246.1 hypothetical protein AQD68_28680 [Klebsiella pneumoniae]OJE56116.1 hypothetical protein AQD70_06340 [Klebsiella pneumoniae]OJE58950.1 hypothetical protein AQD69_02795 [Klebsiella pneumoniae]OJE75433.1 hypothetical protein AQD71_12225 [Klebsiella pneumoniae]
MHHILHAAVYFKKRQRVVAAHETKLPTGMQALNGACHYANMRRDFTTIENRNATRHRCWYRSPVLHLLLMASNEVSPGFIRWNMV